MIEIDGSFGEGGGQILRSSLALSLLTRKPFRLRRIRANRKPKPGLQPQHLMCVRAAAQIGAATTKGDAVGSSDLTFEPGQIQPGQYRFAIGTAGSTSLVLQTIFLPLAMADRPSEITIEGGTHNKAAPCFHFLETTWRAYLQKMGFRFELEMKRPGFYPRGGGQIIANIQPTIAVRPLHLKGPCKYESAEITSTIADLPDHVANRQARRAMVRLRDAGIETTTSQEHWQNGPGSVLLIRLNSQIQSLFVGLGAKGKPAEAAVAYQEALQVTLGQLKQHAGGRRRPVV